ncbi:FHA domain-containing protein [Eubacteriaceae bacterium ES2]|nr:FHA domain-containing protein [Eubacteriaceae bacterium ES2]
MKENQIETDLFLVVDGKENALKSSPFVLGRDPLASDLCLNQKTISRKHLELSCTDGRWYAEDLNSSAGTVLNGVKMDPGRKLEIVAGDFLELSDVTIILQSHTNATLKTASTEPQTGNSADQINLVRSNLRQFLAEANLDAQNLNRLSALIDSIILYNGDGRLLNHVVAEIISESSPVQKLVQTPTPPSPIKKQPTTTKNAPKKLPVFHPVKVEGEWKEIPVTKIPFTIGRGPDNVDFVLSAKGVSRSHCLVSCHDGAYHITDLGSINGIFLNKKQLKPNDHYPIKNGDSISLGINQFYVEI